MSGGLHSACLMAVDMAAGGADDPLPGTEKGGDSGEVHLGAAGEELHLGVGGAQPADKASGPGAVGVVPIAGVALQIGGGQGLQNLGVGPEGVVVAEEILLHLKTSIQRERRTQRPPFHAG